MITCEKTILKFWRTLYFEEHDFIKYVFGGVLCLKYCLIMCDWQTNGEEVKGPARGSRVNGINKIDKDNFNRETTY